MKSYRNIEQELEQFIRRYYLSRLVKGLILFTAIGLLYIFVILFVEHLFWFNSFWRATLFYGVVSVEFMLMLWLIIMPLFKYFKLQRGIDNIHAAQIIGNHFPHIKDKLLNVVQLNSINNQNELLRASIEQKSKSLLIVPFRNAVNLGKNKVYIKYLFFPLALLMLIYGFDKQFTLTDSYQRVWNYNTAFTPPAPFQFFVLNESLQVVQGQDYRLNVRVTGKSIPDDVQIIFDSQAYYLSQVSNDLYQYVFKSCNTDIVFNIKANTTLSSAYSLKVIKAPQLTSLKMALDYPSYTKLQDETLNDGGSTTVPEGTKIQWTLQTVSTDSVTFSYNDTLVFLQKQAQRFDHNMRVFTPFNYTLQTSNNALKDFETYNYNIGIIKDEAPQLSIQVKRDTLYEETLYFYGQISDDYGLYRLQLVYRPKREDAQQIVEPLELHSPRFQEFAQVFPAQRELEENTTYELYFEVTDNDPYRKGKRTRSEVFFYNSKDEYTEAKQKLETQAQTTKDVEALLDKLMKQEQALKTFSTLQKEQKGLRYSDQKQLKEFIERQQAQDELLKQYNKKMADNLEQFNSTETDEYKEQLSKRLQQQSERLQQDEKLLSELQELANKISQEELAKKLDDVAQQNINKQRSLKQLVELTKRYYVSQKVEQLQERLDNLANEQQALSEKSKAHNSLSDQKDQTEQFEALTQELAELKLDNNTLSKPISIPETTDLETSIKKDQNQAEENLSDQKQSTGPAQDGGAFQEAQKSQTKAAQKMRLMSQQMRQASSSGSANQMNEDIEMLRQILDNLLLFSFDQEALLLTFKALRPNQSDYPKYIVKQSTMRPHFEHVDDSLFALSLRQPMISEVINKEVAEVYSNIDKALEQLSENKTFEAVGYQRYVLSSANRLAAFLSDTLDAMEAQMSLSMGQGEGDMQLPDIIVQQEELNAQAQQMNSKKGEQKGGAGKSEGDGEPSNEGLPQQTNSGGQAQTAGQDGETSSGELFEIFKKQQELREALQEQLSSQGIPSQSNTLVKSMEDIERNLINEGLTPAVINRMQQLKHQMIKLNSSTYKQGKDNRRTSEFNKGRFSTTSAVALDSIKQFFNTKEILNRQPLPLRQDFRQKVQQYFKIDYDRN